MNKVRTVFFFILLLFAANAMGQTSFNVGGVQVPVRCSQSISSKRAQSGQTLLFETTLEVAVNGTVVIPRGSTVKAKIVAAKKAQFMGKRGYIDIQLNSIVLKDGKTIPLQSNIYSFKGKSNAAIAYATVIFYGIGALVKGKNVVINQGTNLTATIAANTFVTVNTPTYSQPKINIPQYAKKDPTIPKGEATNRVTRDNPGKTALERTIIRWFFDSDPKGAQISWRVVSSIPDEVKNSNEVYLGNTPYEETRAFNILGLTYENSRDVQIEIKIRKKGFSEQTRRYNVRQAIDQQEISAFINLVEE